MQLLWRSAFSIALFALLACVIGFWLALQPSVLRQNLAASPLPRQDQPATESPLPATGQVRIVTLGDSLTRGAGDANGQGYVGLIRDQLEKETGEKPLLNNLAINGLQSVGLLEQLEQSHVRQLLGHADLILFTIGGNDLFRQSGGLYELDEAKLTEAMDRLSANYAQILSRLRALNSKATIVYTALYNPFGDTDAAGDSTRHVLAWNSKAAEIAAAYPHVIVVPTYDLFLHKEQKYLYTDHFHPNSEGYARMAERILQALQ